MNTYSKKRLMDYYKNEPENYMYYYNLFFYIEKYKGKKIKNIVFSCEDEYTSALIENVEENENCIYNGYNLEDISYGIYENNNEDEIIVIDDVNCSWCSAIMFISF